MKITTISVSSQLKRPRLDSDFATDSVIMTLTAQITKDEDVAACVKHLQSQCDALAIAHLEGLCVRYAQRTREVLDARGVERARQATQEKTHALAIKHGGAF